MAPRGGGIRPIENRITTTTSRRRLLLSSQRALRPRQLLPQVVCPHFLVASVQRAMRDREAAVVAEEEGIRPPSPPAAGWWPGSQPHRTHVFVARGIRRKESSPVGNIARATIGRQASQQGAACKPVHPPSSIVRMLRGRIVVGGRRGAAADEAEGGRVSARPLSVLFLVAVRLERFALDNVLVQRPGLACRQGTAEILSLRLQRMVGTQDRPQQPHRSLPSYMWRRAPPPTARASSIEARRQRRWSPLRVSEARQRGTSRRRLTDSSEMMRPLRRAPASSSLSNLSCIWRCRPELKTMLCVNTTRNSRCGGWGRATASAKRNLFAHGNSRGHLRERARLSFRKSPQMSSTLLRSSAVALAHAATPTAVRSAEISTPTARLKNRPAWQQRERATCVVSLAGPPGRRGRCGEGAAQRPKRTGDGSSHSAARRGTAPYRERELAYP